MVFTDGTTSISTETEHLSVTLKCFKPIASVMRSIESPGEFFAKYSTEACELRC